MKSFPIISLILIIFGIMTGLSGSGWFWLTLLIFPLIVTKRFFPKSKSNDGVLTFLFFVGIFGFIFISGLVEAGELSFGEIITFIYIVLFFLMIGKVFFSNKSAMFGLGILGVIMGMFATAYITSSMNKLIAQETAKKAATEKVQNDKIAAINAANALKQDPTALFLKELETKYQSDAINLGRVKNIKVNTGSIEFIGLGIKIKRVNEYSPTITGSVQNIAGGSGETYFLPKYANDTFGDKIPSIQNWSNIVESTPGNTQSEKASNLIKILSIKKSGIYDVTGKAIKMGGLDTHILARGYFTAIFSEIKPTNIVTISGNQLNTNTETKFSFINGFTESGMLYPIRLLEK